MISLDQVLLLEQKVESAVAKITQLQAENDALRSKCAELTNALSSKSELLSNFEQNQGRIENGILKALDRLNSIENSVLSAASQASLSQTAQTVQTQQSEQFAKPVQAPQEQNTQELPVQTAFAQEQTEQPQTVQAQQEPQQTLQNQQFSQTEVQNVAQQEPTTSVPQQSSFFELDNASSDNYEQTSEEEPEPQEYQDNLFDDNSQASSEPENGQFDIF